MPTALALCFFVSGATSLVLEVTWAKELSYALGNTLHAVSTVIAAFMAGLAFGSWLASRRLRNVRRPLLVYGVLQLLIAVLGYHSIDIFRATAPLFEWLHAGLVASPALFLIARFAVVFALVLVPVTFMGMTLPVVVGAMSRGRSQYAFESGLLYGVNTLGAVTGTLVAGFLLIPQLGLTGTCAAVGVVDAVVAMVALGLHLFTARAVVPKATSASQPSAAAESPHAWRADAVAALYLASGLTAIALEVIWFRYLAYVFGATADAFSVMLGVYLVGVGLGSVAGARWARSTLHPARLVAALELAVALFVLLGAFPLNALPLWYADFYWKLPTESAGLAAALAQSTVAAIVVLPATLALGALFPAVVRCYAGFARVPPAAGHGVGLLYALNTVGGILGSLLMGFWLLPWLGIWNALLAAAVASAGVGGGFLLLTHEPRWRRALTAGGACASLVALALLLPRPDLLALNRGINLAFFNNPDFGSETVKQHDNDRRLLFYEEGVNASVAVTANDAGEGNLALRISGKPVASTTVFSRAHLEMLGQLPTLFAREPRRAAVVGFGAGITTGAVLARREIERVDVIELERAVIRASRYFAYINGDALNDPRTRVTVEDGRTFLRYSKERYDVVTADPISPVIAGAANLYTTGFYEIASARLADGGVFCQWLETWIPSEQTYRGMLASIRSVFPHVAIFMGFGETVVLASRDPIRIPWQTFRERFEEPIARRRFAAMGIDSAAMLLTHFLGGDEQVAAYLSKPAELNTDDHNWLERRMVSDLRRRRRRLLDPVLRAELRVNRIEALRELVPGVPLREIAQLAANPGDRDLGAPPDELLGDLLAFYQKSGDIAAEEEVRALRATHATSARSAVSEETYQDLFFEAAAARAAGRDREAEAGFRKLLEARSHPHRYQSGVALVRLLARSGRLREALTHTRRLARETPARVPAFALEVHILRELRAYDEAIEAIERGLLFNPGDPVLLELRDEEARRP